MEEHLIQYYPEKYDEENQQCFKIFVDGKFELPTDGKDVIKEEKEEGGFKIQKKMEDLITKIDILVKYIKDLKTNTKEEEEILKLLDIKKNKYKEILKVFRKEVDDYHCNFDYYSQVLDSYKKRYNKLGIWDTKEKKMLINSSIQIQLLIIDFFDNLMFMYNGLRPNYDGDEQFLKELFEKYHLNF